MTGFGKAVAEFGAKKITVEVKSLNSKQLDMSVRMPSLYKEKELEIRNLAKNILDRGKVDMYISVESTVADSGTTINVPIVAGYIEQMRAMNKQLGLEMDDASLIKTVIRFPDSLTQKVEEFDEAEFDALMKAVNDALIALDSYRINEGEVLKADLLAHVELIESLSQQIPQFETERVPVIRQKLNDRLNEWLDPKLVDQNRLEQELIYYLEKLDINEEKVRLANHINYFRETVANEEAPGRKLGFIAQEMGREINTTGSKANEANIQKIVVQMKDELEKIKEQSLNVL